MTVSSDLQRFQSALGYTFQNADFLREAVTHSSLAAGARPDNQRLEFLGDRVLGLVIAEALLAADTGAAEGILAPRFNTLVRRETCAEVARKVGLGEVIKLGRSEMLSGGRRKDALLADAMEAVIAAVYRDGGFEAARTVILAHWAHRIETVETDARDPKTALQEWAQARKMPPPVYREVARSGPDHAPLFRIRAELSDGQSAEAEAGSKRAAEQTAARTLLDQITA